MPQHVCGLIVHGSDVAPGHVPDSELAYVLEVSDRIICVSSRLPPSLEGRQMSGLTLFRPCVRGLLHTFIGLHQEWMDSNVVAEEIAYDRSTKTN